MKLFLMNDCMLLVTESSMLLSPPYLTDTSSVVSVKVFSYKVLHSCVDSN